MFSNFTPTLRFKSLTVHFDFMLTELEEGPVKNWYVKHSRLDELYSLAESSASSGYTLDPISGLLFRKLFSDETIKKLGHTVLGIIFPRPTDLHYHPDVNEAISVIKGRGLLFTRLGNSPDTETLFPDKNFLIPKNVPHAFRPFQGEYLEIILACSGILDTNKEVQLERFDRLTVI